MLSNFTSEEVALYESKLYFATLTGFCFSYVAMYAAFSDSNRFIFSLS